MSTAFSGYKIEHGRHIRLNDEFPAYGTAFNGAFWSYTEDTSYVLALEHTELKLAGGYRIDLEPMMYASVPGSFGVLGHGLIITRETFSGLFMVGGPLENFGRLRYIDGCTDTLLISPVKRGDPCLNLLYFPPGIDQTEHTHPSDRFGLIVSGRGVCIHRDGLDAPAEETPLLPGMIWHIHTGGLHKFRTEAEPMRVLAYHPETEFGPTDEDHPMLTRTIVAGVSAADPSLAAIRTK